ncbi:hypothetical protein [Ulvibacterium sp.]|uniref:hypothetical protein n=1 Tax=Ulvibacterium sp. TaxID=2665914 RepID=UPI003CC5CEFA
MAIALEIRDGSPHWYLSPDVWIVKQPTDEFESTPIAGEPCYLKAKVRNGGSTSVSNATVKFYWANPAVGFNRDTANYIGQSFVSLDPDQVQDVLCLVPWVPEYLNGGHECILAEAYHQNDPLTSLIDFNVPTDRHVAQRNLSVQMAENGMFHMNFEIHNAFRIVQKFDIRAEQISVKDISDFNQVKELLKGRKEGKINSIGFSESFCPDQMPDHCDNGDLIRKGISIEGHRTARMAINGEISGDFALVRITQLIDGKITGGLATLIINDKKEKA